MMSAHLLVTGGAGFIGSHLVELLLSEGHRVTVVDDLSTGHLANLPQHPGLQVVAKQVAEVSPGELPQDLHAVAHLAATASVQKAWEHPLAMHHNNLSATVQVLEWCRALTIPRLCFASSAAVYGNPAALPLTEDHPTAPISPYGLQKLAGEQYGRLFAPALGLSFVALRLFNVFGPRQSPASDYAGVIARFAHQVTQGEPLTFHGTGEQTRDFIYVRDVAQAFRQALFTPLPGGQAVVCNIARGQGTSLLSLAQAMQAHGPCGPLPLQFAPGRAGDIQHSVGDPRQAWEKLHFAAKWTVGRGLAEYLRYLAH